MSLTVTGALLGGEPAGLRCEGGLIEAIGPGVAPREGDEVIEAGGAPLVPVLVNGHTHAAMTLFRGFGDDLPLMRWLKEKVWPVEAKLEADDVYWGTRLACAEMIRTGTGRFWDMYWHAPAVAQAVERRGDPGHGGGTADRRSPGDGEWLRAAALESIDSLAGSDASGRRLARPPRDLHGQRGIAALGRGALRRAAPAGADPPLRDRAGGPRLRRRPRGPPRRLPGPSSGCSASRPSSPTASGSTTRSWRWSRSAGSTLVTNPVANMKLAVGGAFPYRRARDAGAAIGLGTDGPGSNNSLDLLSDVKAVCADPEAHRGRRGRADGRRGLAGGARAAPRRCWARPRWPRASRPTSCSCAPTHPSSRSATSRRAWSTRRRAPWSTPPSSRARS